jgi:hypothetical protein
MARELNSTLTSETPVDLSWISDGEASDLIAGKASWRQQPAYAREAAARVGARSRYVLFRRDTRTIAVANLRTRSVPVLGRVTLISHGPTLLGPAAAWPRDLEDVLACLAERRHQHEVGEIRVDCDLALARHAIDPLRLVDAARTDPTRSPYRTIVLDLSQGLDAVRRNLHPKWRRDLQRAERSDLQVDRSAQPGDIAQADALLDNLRARKGFDVPQDASFFARVAEAAHGEERILIHRVRQGGELVSFHIGAYSGDTATYHLGASSSGGLQARAAFLCQWLAVRTAVELGLSWYDTGGIDPEGNPDVYRFKRRMGGTEISAPQSLVLRARGVRGLALALAGRAYYRAGR